MRTELRIGNIVGRRFWNPHPTEPGYCYETTAVCDIKEESVLVYDGIKGSKYKIRLKYEDIRFIKLNIFHLKTLGFVHNDKTNNDFIHKNYPQIRVCLCSGDNYRLITGLFELDQEPIVNHIHELQNIFYSLTKKELIWEC